MDLKMCFKKNSIIVKVDYMLFDFKESLSTISSKIQKHTLINLKDTFHTRCT